MLSRVVHLTIMYMTDKKHPKTKDVHTSSARIHSDKLICR